MMQDCGHCRPDALRLVSPPRAQASFTSAAGARNAAAISVACSHQQRGHTLGLTKLAALNEEDSLEKNWHLVVVVVVLTCDRRPRVSVHARRSVQQIKKVVPTYTLFGQTDWLAPLRLLPPGTSSRKSRRRPSSSPLQLEGNSRFPGYP